ncbi:MAG: bacteriohopanetetrol glucosamine biosynthesis glycosyltransferase HpnI [Acidobacteriia bacterium]|nr:bacteriohopanetetrol glucosamine biosynthesis glycosyltransferase HpnI [Terriglobia bacterium]
MVQNLIRFFEAVALLGALAGCGYYLLCLWSARNFIRDNRRRADAPATWAPPVSILKPLRGTDPDIYESFRSHCVLNYPEYELIFGVSDPNDPAIALVQRLQAEFPQRSIRLMVCPKALGTNLKVSNLVQLLPLAHYDYLIVNDSDIRVDPDYLRRIVREFADPRVGMVTCLYRGIAGKTLGSQLEAIGISTDFSAGVLAARQVEGIRFALGSTLAFPRQQLEAIGGFEPLADYLADDFELGARIAKAGFEVRLSDVVVDHHLPDYSLRAFIQHQLRWGRSTRDARRWGYTGVVLTFGLPWALLTLLLSGGATWAWGVLAVATVLRLAMAIAVGTKVLHDPDVPRFLALLPLRDVVAMMVWIASFAGHTVAWRGDQFILEKGKLRPIRQWPVVSG